MAAANILVVEDDAIIGLLLAEMLETMGYAVCGIATCESDAVGAEERYRPDLMIVDAQLGEGSGVAAMAEINRSRLVPHVFVSGDISRILALRPSAVMLQKPYREIDLSRAIDRALGGEIVPS